MQVCKGLLFFYEKKKKGILPFTIYLFGSCGWIPSACLFFFNCLPPPRYIVYDTAQINLKYLLKTKFNYQTSLW